MSEISLALFNYVICSVVETLLVWKIKIVSVDDVALRGAGASADTMLTEIRLYTSRTSTTMVNLGPWEIIRLALRHVSQRIVYSKLKVLKIDIWYDWNIWDSDLHKNLHMHQQQGCWCMCKMLWWYESCVWSYEAMHFHKIVNKTWWNEPTGPEVTINCAIVCKKQVPQAWISKCN